MSDAAASTSLGLGTGGAKENSSLAIATARLVGLVMWLNLVWLVCAQLLRQMLGNGWRCF